MRRATKALGATLLFAALLATPARADFGISEMNFEFLDSGGAPAMLAGSHPYAFRNTLSVNIDEFGQPEGSPKELIVDFPPGLIGDPKAVPRCSTADFLTLHPDGPLKGQPFCPDSTAVGFIGAKAPNESTIGDFGAAYNLAPGPGVAAKIGFRVLTSFITIDLGIRPSGEHNVFAKLSSIPQIEPFVGSELEVWGNPASPAHDKQRGACITLVSAECTSGVAERPFLTMPRACPQQLSFAFEAFSWQGEESKGEAVVHDSSGPLGPSDCGALGFAPNVDVKPSTDQAESPSGLDFNLDIDDEGLLNPEGRAQSDIKKVALTLPQGMTLNPSNAEGLATCSPQDLDRETLSSKPGEGCPEASKVGTVEAETPLLEGTIFKGSLFVATQDDPATTQPGAENPFDTMIAIYLVVKEPERGILIKQAGKVAPNEEQGPNAGRLVTTFDDLVQAPLSHVRVHLKEGARSPLITPGHCGSYPVDVEFTPWANPGHPFSTSSGFAIDKGVNGGPCPPGGVQPFRPAFSAGSVNNAAKAFSPFDMRLTRQDGEQDMTKFSAILPPGVSGIVAGVDRCPEAQIAAARLKTGRQEAASPSCPANAKVGRTLAGAGVGSQLTYVPGSLYLAGPFGGDPLSVVAITPAIAGPFDAGTVVVRVALTLNPDSGEVEVDGSHSEPIPHILKGIVLKLRDLRVYADRAKFTFNPTSCTPSSARATLFGSFLDVFSPADDVPVSLSDRYQAAGCAGLGFKPKFTLNLKGGTKRGDYQSLRAVVKPGSGPGFANIASAAVTLPHSAFLANEHIRTVCTRVQFAAGAGNGAECPPGSVYGRARAVTPLLDDPLEGPVFLRSSSHPLPDLVVALHGIIDIDLVGQTDSINEGIRNTFASVPDAPADKFVLELFGGKKALIVNSRNLCQGPKQKATAHFTGQNGKVYDIRPVVQNSCKKQSKKPKKAKKH
jgi:hypothetical protein